MKSSRRIYSGVLAAVLGCLVLSVASAEDDTTTSCDNMCGDSSACKYTCCHITWTTIDGIRYPKKVNCSSSTCCAHPSSHELGTTLGLPQHEVHGVSGPIRFAFAGEAELCQVQVQADDGAETVELKGTVASQALKAKAQALAEQHAQGYKVKNSLSVGKLEKAETGQASSMTK